MEVKLASKAELTVQKLARKLGKNSEMLVGILLVTGWVRLMVFWSGERMEHLMEAF